MAARHSDRARSTLANVVGNGAEEANDASQPAVVGEFGVGDAAEGGAAGRVDDGPFEPGPVAVVVDVAGAAVDPVREFSVNAVDVGADLLYSTGFCAAVDVVAVVGPDLFDHFPTPVGVRLIPGRDILVDLVLPIHANRFTR